MHEFTNEEIKEILINANIECTHYMTSKLGHRAGFAIYKDGAYHEFGALGARFTDEFYAHSLAELLYKYKVKEAKSEQKTQSDGSTADYYELPEGATQLQDLVAYKNMNAQIGEIQRAVYRYGQVGHSEKLRDAKKIKFYAEAEIARLEKYGE